MSVKKRRRDEKVREAIDVAFKDRHLRNLSRTRYGLAIDHDYIQTLIRGGAK